MKVNHLTGALIAISLTLGLSSTVYAQVIDFEAFGTGNLSNSEVIDGVEFSVASPTPTTVIRIFDDPVKTSFILACDIAVGFDCTQDMNVDFGVAVTDLSFEFTSDEIALGNSSGTVTAYLNGAVVGSMDLLGDGNPSTNSLIDLSALGMIDQLVLTSSLDPAGLGYDNFSFTAVPLPAAVWLFGSGLVGLISVARRKKQA